jgi:thioredoxin reductase (NADPH)
MKTLNDIIIIGGGPIGLYFASKCEEKNLDYLLLEGSDALGGQLTRLYPEKQIVDIPGIESIKSADYIELLKRKINLDKIVLNAHVTTIKNGDEIEICAGKTVYFCKKLIIATGLGTSVPRPLGVEHENECDNIIYSVKSFNHLKNKKVAIFGGGDSALDWAKEISAISNNVHLIHRRLEFRGNPDTIKDCKNLKVHLPHVPSSITYKNGKATSITIKKVDTEELLTIDVDYIFVNYGNIASLSSFPFKMENAFLVVDENNKVEQNVFAIGDVCQYQTRPQNIIG